MSRKGCGSGAPCCLSFLATECSLARLHVPHMSPKWTASGFTNSKSCLATVTSSSRLKSMVKVGTLGVKRFAWRSTAKTWHPAFFMAREKDPDPEKNSTNVVWRGLAGDSGSFGSQWSHWLYGRFDLHLKHSWTPNLHLFSFCLLHKPHWYFKQRHPLEPFLWQPCGNLRQLTPLPG